MLDTVVVAGAGIGGLLAAAAAAPHAERVVVLDRDRLGGGRAIRPGAPQAAHAHGLLASGRGAMEALLPGLTAELVAAGAVSRGDIGSTGRWWIGGAPLADTSIGLQGLAISRGLLEATLRERVAALANVELRERTEIRGLVADGVRVTGVRVPGATVPADLLVDASGRAARAGRWFAASGWALPDEDVIEVGLHYVTSHVEARPDDFPGRSVVISAAVPDVPRGGVALLQDDGTWIITLFAYNGERPPVDEDGFRAFAGTIVSPDLVTVLAGRPLLEAPRPFRFPACRRRHVERLDGPVGYLPMGDAIASFDPTFGQGMSVAAMQAVALGEELAAGTDGLEGRFTARAAAIADRAWTVVNGAVLALPGVIGEAAPGHAEATAYVRAVVSAAHHDPVVSAAFFKVTNLVEPVTSLMAPEIAKRVMATVG
jgi:2-polyprenyl-6-methoxyphenol hydroxylase-like FAD-dependent oxidoreductase